MAPVCCHSVGRSVLGNQRGQAQEPLPKQDAMKKILLIAMLVCGCLHDPYERPANYYRDALWCWHKDPSGHWIRLGLARQCPDYTREFQ